MEWKEILKLYGFAFKKQWGQNFLTDGNLLSAIVQDAGVTSQTTVLEIGAGAGTLSRAIAKRSRRLCAFEIDETLFPILDETLDGLDNVQLFSNNVLELNA